MRISCPNCSAAYEVPESALATGPRLLRCARCGHQFQAALPGAPPPAAGAPASGAPASGTPGPAASGPRATAAPPPPPSAPAPPGPGPQPPLAPPPLAPPERAPPRPEAGPPAAAPRHAPPGRGSAPPGPEARSTARLRDAPASKADRFALIGWVVSLVLLGAAGYAMVAWRDPIIAAWPPALRLYMLLGLA